MLPAEQTWNVPLKQFPSIAMVTQLYAPISMVIDGAFEQGGVSLSCIRHPIQTEGMHTHTHIHTHTHTNIYTHMHICLYSDLFHSGSLSLSNCFQHNVMEISKI